MNNTAATTLQYYTPRVYNALADVVSSAFLFGTLAVLSVVSAGNLVHRGVKHTSTAFMFGSVVVLFSSTTIHFGAIVAYSVGYCRLLNDAVAALSSTSSTSTALAHFAQSTKINSYIISVALAINVTIGDAVVWWRVCVLWRQKSVIALGIVLLAGTFGLGILSVIHRSAQIDVYTQLLLHYGDVYGGMSGAVSLLTNMIATLLIGRKAWKHRQILRQGRGVSKGGWITPTMKVLMLLVESGTIYSVFLAVAVAYNGVSRSPSSQTSDAEFVSVTRVFLTGCFAPILAIYPTIIIFIVALNRSPIDRSLVNSADIISSLTFRGSSSAIHLSRSNTRSSHTDRASDSPENQSTEEPRARESPGEIGLVY